MAQPQLHELLEWLKRSDANRFEIYNLDTGQSIENCVSYEDLTAGGSTPEEYFSRILNKGVKTVQLQKKRKNGSSWKREDCGYNYGLSTEGNVAASGQSASSGPATPQQPANYNNIGLMGHASHGLGFPEIMTMRSQADRYEETKTENRELKAKIERLERENRTLETENLQYKFGADSKPSAVDKLVEGLASNPAALAQVIQSFKGSSVPGLNAPQQEQPKLSDTKTMVIDTISNPHVSDEHVTAAYYVLIQAVQNNQKFLERYHQLLTDFNLIQHGSDGDSDSI